VNLGFQNEEWEWVSLRADPEIGRLDIIYSVDSRQVLATGSSDGRWLPSHCFNQPAGTFKGSIRLRPRPVKIVDLEEL
jgi:hypothetical protein